MITRMQQRRGTSLEWQTVADTVILASGEIGLETDTNRYKVGDGVSSWSNLSYFISDEYNSQTYAKLTANQSLTGTQQIVSTDPNGIPLTAKGLVGHATDLQQWAIEDSENNEPVIDVVASLDETGKISVNGIDSAGDITLLSADPENPARIRGLPNVFDYPDEAVSKAYVDTAGSGIAVKPPVQAATTGNIATLSGTMTIDGISVIAGNRVLVKNQTDKKQNGIYVVASGVWTRATDTNSANNTKRGTYVLVEAGTANENTSWVLYTEGTGANGGIDFGVDELQFELFFNPGDLSAGNGLIKTGVTFSALGTTDKISVTPTGITIADTYAGQSSITTVGTITSGTWNGSTIPVSNGGTGATNLTGFLYGNGTGAFTANPLIDGATISSDINVRAANVTGVVGIGNGGTNATTIEQARANLNVPSNTDFVSLSNSVNTALLGLVPSGSIIQFAGPAAPTGYVLCDGAEYDKVGQYAALFAAIGGQYGQTTTKFRVPNLKGKVPLGLGGSDTDFNALGKTGGAKTHQLTAAQMPSHTHRVPMYRTTGDGVYGYGLTKTGGFGDRVIVSSEMSITSESSGSGTAHNNMQPYIVLNYIIKL